MKKTLHLLGVLWLTCIAAFAQPTAVMPTGSGTEDSPYLIADMSNLLWLAQNSTIWSQSFYYKQTADIDASGTATWNSGEGWSPIGNNNTYFRGNYDGGGFTISSLTINRPTSDYQGLFGCTSNTIKNLNLTITNITGKNNIGAITGLNYNTINNCSSTGKITGTEYIGGIAGYNSHGIISSCSSSCNTKGSNNTGGIVGYSWYGQINNCYSTGTITGTYSSNGGLIGNASYTNILNSYSTGAITNGGGLIGSSYSNTAKGCFWDKEASTKTTSAGGIGKTTAEMQSLTTFIEAGWDFKVTEAEGIWNIGNSRNNLYPYLNREYPSDPEITATHKPFVTTTSVTAIMSITATVNSSVSLIGNPAATQHGVCWSTSAAPTTSDSKTEEGTINATGSYTSLLTGLIANTTYYVRAYAINGLGTVYGEEFTFTTLAIEPIEPQGLGTQQSPYLIANLANLLWISQNPTYWNSSTYYKQTANIDASGTASWKNGEGWIVIGTDNQSFYSKYDGGGYSISGLTINRPDGSNQGLFSNAYGTISNLKITDANIIGYEYVGALAGSHYGTVTQCSSSGVVNGKYSTGGLIGYSSGTSISGCISSCSVSGTGNIGGLTGYIYYTTIENCYSKGSVSGTSSTGGLIGYTNNNTIKNCYSMGAVTNGGGLIGSMYNATLSGSYWDTETSGQTTGTAGQGKTTAEMQSFDTFISSGWDFKGAGTNGIWNIGNSRNNQYPYLNWEYPSDPQTSAPYKPYVTTKSVSSILVNTATMNCSVTLVGNPVASQHGVCWATTTLPTVSDSKTEDGVVTEAGDYASQLTGLVANTTYFARAYASNTQGINYGAEITFTTLAINPVTPQGLGTQQSPYLIANLSNLLWISQNPTHWNKYYKQTADIDASSTATWNGGKGWQAIGNYTKNFYGNYNGGGHIITGLTINRPDENHQGLFGYSEGFITDLRLTNVDISGRNYVGGLVGYNGKSISQCSTSGEVNGSELVGGITGFNSYATVNKCLSSCTVAGTNNIGGLIGSNNSGEITDCYSKGSVSGTNSIGGLVGSSYTYTYSTYKNIKNCFSTGTVTTGGGLIGTWNVTTVTACFWDTQTSGKTTSAAGQGKTTAEMQNFHTFFDNGYKFKTISEESVWNIGNSRNGGYPYLDWEYPNDAYPTNAVVANIKTRSIGGITATGATIIGEIIFAGTPAATQHGICWSTSETPDINANTISLGAVSAKGTFNGVVTGLLPETTYYARAFATNSEGTAYGDIISFTTLATGAITLCEAVDNCNLLFSTGGDANWFAQTTTSKDGVDAARTGAIAYNQNCWMETTVEGFADLTFQWKISSNSSNRLTFYIDGVENNFIYGNNDYWITQSYYISGGTHTLKWIYTKNSTTVTGDDCAWVDQITVTPVTCPYPGNLSVTDITKTGAKLEWIEANAATKWNIEWGIYGFSKGTGTVVSNLTQTSYQLDNLTAGTRYDFYVQSKCSDTDQSLWSGPYTFTTECNDIVLPYSEDFDESVSTTYLPPCWSKTGSGDYMTATSNNYAYSSNYSTYLNHNNYSEAILVMPHLSATSMIKEVRLNFKLMPNTSFSEKLYIGTMSDPNDAATFTKYEEVDVKTGSSWSDYTVFFDKYTGTNQYIAFKWGATDADSYGSVYIDNVSLSVIPVCAEPNNIQAINTTMTETEIIWNQHGSVNAWTIEWGTTGFTKGEGIIETIAGDATYKLTNLTAGTAYDLYIQTKCTDTESSIWMGPFQFHTAIEGDNCSNAINLSKKTSPYNGSTIYALNDYSFCNMGSSNDVIFFYDVESNGIIEIGQTTNDFDSRHTMRWGGSCPGETVIGCLDDFDNTPFAWTNTTSQTQRVWFIIGGYDSNSKGTFTLNWTYTSPACKQPINLEAASITKESAELSWAEAGTATSWDVEYGAAGFTLGTGTQSLGLTASELTLSSLTASTEYQFYVRSICGVDNNSGWSGPYSFTTLSDGTAIDNNQSDRSVVIYPNPFRSELNVIVKQTLTDHIARLYDVFGQKVMEVELNGQPLSLSELASGIYFLNIDGKSYKVIKK